MAWNASVQISFDGDFYHVYAPIDGDSLDEAKAGAKHVLNTFASGKLAFIRAEPEAEEYRNFDTQKTIYKGFVRFSYKDEPGEWQRGDRQIESLEYVGLGSAAI